MEVRVLSSAPLIFQQIIFAFLTENIKATSSTSITKNSSCARTADYLISIHSNPSVPIWHEKESHMMNLTLSTALSHPVLLLLKRLCVIEHQ